MFPLFSGSQVLLLMMGYRTNLCTCTSSTIYFVYMSTAKLLLLTNNVHFQPWLPNSVFHIPSPRSFAFMLSSKVHISVQIFLHLQPVSQNGAVRCTMTKLSAYPVHASLGMFIMVTPNRVVSSTPDTSGTLWFACPTVRTNIHKSTFQLKLAETQTHFWLSRDISVPPVVRLCLAIIQLTSIMPLIT